MSAKKFLLIAGGVDKKGIVYKLTKILKDYEFNIEDSSMVMLRRTFSIIMLLTNKSNIDEKKFNNDICKFMNENQMMIDLKIISDKEMMQYREEGNIYMISISGADKPGIVNKITEILFKNGVNIIDLETKSSEKVKPHAYYMHMEVDVPKKVNIKNLEKKLKDAGKKIGVFVNIYENEKEIL